MKNTIKGMSIMLSLALAISGTAGVVTAYADETGANEIKIETAADIEIEERTVSNKTKEEAAADEAGGEENSSKVLGSEKSGFAAGLKNFGNNVRNLFKSFGKFMSEDVFGGKNKKDYNVDDIEDEEEEDDGEDTGFFVDKAVKESAKFADGIVNKSGEFAKNVIGKTGSFTNDVVGNVLKFAGNVLENSKNAKNDRKEDKTQKSYTAKDIEDLADVIEDLAERYADRIKLSFDDDDYEALAEELAKQLEKEGRDVSRYTEIEAEQLADYIEEAAEKYADDMENTFDINYEKLFREILNEIDEKLGSSVTGDAGATDEADEDTDDNDTEVDSYEKKVDWAFDFLHGFRKSYRR